MRIADDRHRSAGAGSPPLRQRLPDWLSSLIGVVLYAAIDTALVFLRPEFSILRNAESDYGSRGAWAWLMDLKFVLRCLLAQPGRDPSPHTRGEGFRQRAAVRVGLGLLIVVGRFRVTRILPRSPSRHPTRKADSMRRSSCVSWIRRRRQSDRHR